ncbi:MAG: V-type ATP synthase subunit D [Candidatus Omnitrophica bacterium CG12_big_fil_rev_8_21_14_0_65_50_5]|nr:MAG: V-type ATP synthase subunit D [Candidatus Omnitrophica bacterium CG12_big_fil_rev_8_21_14_0_65_50_5]
MAKIKFTKGELKKQRESLKQYRHYLPTLQLKKQQLQMKIFEIQRDLFRVQEQMKAKSAAIEEWSGVFAETSIDFRPWIHPEKIELGSVNVAGAVIPVLDKLVFPKVEFDLYLMPLWADRALEYLKEYVKIFVEHKVVQQQIRVLTRELMITTQRVNLFEKVKIPESLENIRKIRIYLGDQQANAVGISKVAKKKVEERELQFV